MNQHADHHSHSGMITHTPIHIPTTTPDTPRAAISFGL